MGVSSEPLSDEEENERVLRRERLSEARQRRLQTQYRQLITEREALSNAPAHTYWKSGRKKKRLKELEDEIQSAEKKLWSQYKVRPGYLTEPGSDSDQAAQLGR